MWVILILLLCVIITLDTHDHSCMSWLRMNWAANSYFLFGGLEKDCNAWNLTLWAGNEQSAGDDYGRNVFGSFCGRDGRQEVRVPEDMVEAHIR